MYSLGVILYELLTGRLPFDGKILDAEPTPPSQLRPELNPVLDAICARALARAPERRYPSMKAFAAVLIDYLKTTPATEGAGQLVAKTPAEGAVNRDQPPAAQTEAPCSTGLPGRDDIVAALALVPGLPSRDDIAALAMRPNRPPLKRRRSPRSAPTSICRQSGRPTSRPRRSATLRLSPRSSARKKGRAAEEASDVSPESVRTNRPGERRGAGGSSPPVDEGERRGVSPPVDAGARRARGGSSPPVDEGERRGVSPPVDADTGGLTPRRSPYIFSRSDAADDGSPSPPIRKGDKPSPPERRPPTDAPIVSRRERVKAEEASDVSPEADDGSPSPAIRRGDKPSLPESRPPASAPIVSPPEGANAQEASDVSPDADVEGSPSVQVKLQIPPIVLVLVGAAVVLGGVFFLGSQLGIVDWGHAAQEADQQALLKARLAQEAKERALREAAQLAERQARERAAREAAERAAREAAESKVTKQTVVSLSDRDEAEDEEVPSPWANAARQAVLQGGVRVRVSGLRMEAKRLHVRLLIENTGTAPGMVFHGWGVATGKNAPRLLDDRDTPWYAVPSDPDARLPGQASAAEPLAPGRPVTDVLVFAASNAPTAFLRLELPGPSFGGSGQLRLQVPKSMLLPEAPRRGGFPPSGNSVPF